MAETQAQGLCPWLSSRWRPTGKSVQFADSAMLHLACLPANNYNESDQRSSVAIVNKLCSVVSVGNVGRSLPHESSTLGRSNSPTLGRSNSHEYCNNCMLPYNPISTVSTAATVLRHRGSEHCCFASANSTDVALSSRHFVCIYNLEYHSDPCQIASGTLDLRGSAGGWLCYPRPVSVPLRSRIHETTYAPDGIVAQVAPVRRPSDRTAP